jgi:WD40 repeat protein
MVLVPGSKLGRYEIVSAIGAGGMGEVYRARDLQLGRDVAIKVLSTDISLDKERLQRFEQEARITAATNHPNILAIYDIGTHENRPFIVSELLEGQTIGERLITGPFTMRRALEIAMQVADGLAVAHEKGIIHRDLKPDNLFLTKAGHVKILDFGIAKLTKPEAADSQQTTATVAGLVLGTLTYMSPEQVCGATVDHRSDIFSLGSVLYEMLTGAAAFHRPTRTEAVRAILDLDPLDSPQAQKIPPAAQRVLQHCLEKDPAHRFQSARDLAFDLSGVLTEASLTQRIPVHRARRMVSWRTLLEAALLIAAVAAVFFLARHPTMPRPEFHRLTYERGTIAAARFAPDQLSVVYSASWAGSPLQIYSTTSDFPNSRAIGYENSSLLAASRAGDLAILSKGRLSAHLVVLGGTLARAPLAGGAPREVLENVRWADWDPHGELAVVHHQAGRSRLEYPIGKVLYETSGWISHIRFSPQGDRIAFLDHPIWSDDRGSVCVMDLVGNKTILSDGWQAADGLAWSPRGEVWVSAIRRGVSRALYALDSSGQDRLVLAVPGGITLQDIANDGRVMLTFEDERLILRGSDGSEREHDLSWFDWTIARGISSDGKWVLFEEAGEPAGEHYMVGMRKFDNSPPLRLGEGSPGGLSADGKWVVETTPTQLTLLPTGAGQPVAVPVVGLENFGSARIMPDGEHILLNAQEKGRPDRTYLIDLHGGKPRPITPEGMKAFTTSSPDGKLLAAAGQDGLVAIYPLDGSPARSIPGLTAGYISIGWTADSSSIYVSEAAALPSKVYRVEIATGKRHFVRDLMPADPAGVVNISNVVVTPDAKAYAYNHYRVLSTLYVVNNLK